MQTQLVTSIQNADIAQTPNTGKCKKVSYLENEKQSRGQYSLRPT